MQNTERAKAESNLLQTVKAFLNFEATAQPGMSYEKRAALKRLHRTALRDAVEECERAAFTLVEMLVAVALVVVMMTLFAAIFQMATSALATQKGLAENDQRARLVETLLRNDLNGNKVDTNSQPRSYRTFRIVIPYGQNESIHPIDPISGTNASDDDRLGYFAISENNPFDDTDDVLSLTVALPVGSSERFYGKAAVVLPDANGNYGPNNPNPGNGYPGSGYPAPAASSAGQYWLNQPEFDDYLGAVNQSGNSTVAEVVYFLRHGTLYRRVMLIRKPNVKSEPQDGTPDNSPTVPATALSLAWYGAGGNPQRNFWSDFDYSAWYDYGTQAVRWHGVGVVNESLTVGASPGPAAANNTSQSFPIKIGNPAYRFGHDTTLGQANPTFGLPREFDTQGNFIGRFTQGETSAISFGYPGNVANGNPLNATFNLTATAGVLSQFSGGYRTGEDALMTNVLKFDIKVWDQKASMGPDGKPGIALVDDDGNGTVDDLTELGMPGSDDGAFVDIGHSGVNGCYSAAASLNTYFSPGVTGNNWPNKAPIVINRFDTWNPYLNMDGDGFLDWPAYGPTRYINGAGQQNPVKTSPNLYPVGVGPDGRPGKANLDDDGINGIDDPGELGWPGTDDFLPLSAIQIKITFYETTSKQLREMTFVQSLLYSQ